MRIGNALAAWRAWRTDWDGVCDRCGLCCYERTVEDDGAVGIDFSRPCEFLDEDTMLCRTYETRFDACEGCRRLTPLTALFGKHLPPTCAYVRAFRR